jgi:hypothetical protein
MVRRGAPLARGRLVRRAAIAVVLALTACSGGAPGESVDDEALVQTARDLVAAIEQYDCERLATYLPEDAPAYFAANIDGPLMDTSSGGPLERVCFVLGVIQQYPRAESMEIRATSQTAERVDLLLRGGSDRADLVMVRDPQGWKLQKEWALKQVQDLRVHLDLYSWAMTEDSYYYYGGETFTDDAAALTARTQTVIEFTRGVATPDSPEHLVHAMLGPDAKSVCGSARSRSGELFMIRQAADGSSSRTSGRTLPATCPAGPLRGDW